MGVRLRKKEQKKSYHHFLRNQNQSHYARDAWPVARLNKIITQGQKLGVEILLNALKRCVVTRLDVPGKIIRWNLSPVAEAGTAQ